MRNIYYTARGGQAEPERTQRQGARYTLSSAATTPLPREDALETIGEYVHQSGGAGIDSAIRGSVRGRGGIDTNGGYYKHWREAVNPDQHLGSSIT